MNIGVALAALIAFSPLLGWGASIESRLAQYGAAVRARLAPQFKAVGIVPPPKRVVLVGLKEEQKLEVWVSSSTTNHFRLLKTYPILAASGRLGPKLAEGDNQVPEGLYQVESLNPNSRFHLSLRVNYPNAFDKTQARKDGRKKLGGDIMIHGNAVSIGCIAVGDVAAEELFVLAAQTGIQNISVILSPVDFRVRDLPPGTGPLPAWTSDLYPAIKKALAPLQTEK
jgi:murein L,D-transpeptidase YafK